MRARFRSSDFGTRGSPVVLVPGLASGAWVWKDTIDALKGDASRVCRDALRDSTDVRPVAGDPMRVALDALRDLVAKEHLDKPVIVGHSLGGMLALQLAAGYPDLVSGVVTIDGLPVFPTTENVPSAERAALGERMRRNLRRRRRRSSKRSSSRTCGASA
jgi:pimeloyl-ACP methyl ester carboxylesterase